ncbi:MAG: amino acid adenylation domain-containing protein, partial [Acidobacteria bacterium]|nr:amino acid adenylation domain-containing protein [Acidobacteriota bacterium]
MTNENTSIDAAIAAVQKGKERDYWFNRFADVPGKVTFPYDIPTGIGTGSQDARVEFQWTGELFEKLHTVMKGSDYKLYMILMAGLILLLNKYSGQDDITVGTPVLKQELEVKFINTMLALRNHIDTDIAFKDFLLQVRQTVIEGTENQNYPLQSLLNLLNLTEKEGESFPLFDTAILLTGIHDKNYLKDFRVNTLFLFTRTGNHITGELQYNSRLYDQVTMANLVNHFGFLLQDALGNPGKKLKSVEITGEVEKERLICQLNNTAIDFPLQQTIGNVFAGCAGKVSHRLAAVYEENQITYRELHEKSNLLAVFLKKRGIGDGDIVGLMVDRSLEMLIGILGILKAGGAYLPIDSEYPGDRNLFLLKDSRARLLLWQKSLMRLEKNSHLRAYFPGQFTIPLDDPAVYENPGSSLEMSGCPANPAYVIYTSGTTGVPKGVMVEHRHVLNLVYGLEQRIYKYYQNHLHVCMVSPYVFDASVKQIFTVLILGHTLHIVSQQTRTDALRLIEYYFRHRIEISDGTPTHISLLSENLRGSQREIIEGFPVRRFIIGGEALSKQVVEQFLAIFGVNPPGITNVYGPTECTVDAASFDILPQNLHLYRSIVIGKPMPNFQIYILDREGLLQPVGVSGELCIGGSGVSRGYLNRPELTAEKFRPQITQMAQMTLMKNKNSTLRADLNAFGDEKNFSHSAFDLPRIQHSNLYCTGDLARWLHDGCLEYLGRIDRQVKIRGFRVELGEIENALLQHEAVKAVVVTVKDDRENDSMICAYIVFTAALSSNDLRDFLAGRLPYYLIPQYFIPIEKIPLTWNGKVDHKALPAPGIKTGQEIILPRNQQEEKLLSAWSEVLKIEKEKISIADDFFALGGHSLKAALMVARVHKILDVKVPLGVVFANPTIHSLAEYISHTAKSRFTVIEPAPVKDYYALSSAQKRLYIQQQLQPESTEYNLPVVMLKIKGLPDIQRLEQAFQNLVQRHESFRTGFQVIEGEPMQKIEPGINFQIDYYSMPEAEARPFINRYIRPFDLSRAPLLRAGLIQIDPQTHILMVDMHHIITDATSTQIFIKDLLAFYAGETLPPIPISYKDFSEWHHRLLHSGEIAKQEAYWLNEFSGPIPVLNLPTDEERPPVRSFAGDTLSFALNKQETAGLNQIAQTNNVTLYMILMAVFYVFLHKLSGQEDIIIGADHAGRRHADLEPMIGMFVNSFAMRNYPAPHKTFREFLDEVKERTIAAFDNQDYQFELLVEKVVTERNPGRNPLFDVMFSYHNIAKASAGDVGQKNIEGLTFSAYGFDYKVAKFDLMLHGEETNEQLNLHFEYATRLFKKSTIERFALYFKEMISQLLANSFEGLDKKLAVLELLYPEERKQILENCNGPVIDLPQGETVVHLFAKQVEKKPDHIAFIDGDNRVSYRELAERSDQWADSLTAKGFQNEQIAAVMMDRSLEMAVIILATWKAGGAYIPIDPGYPQERIDYMLKDSKATILITDDENKKTDNCQCSIVNCQLSMSDCPRRGLQHSAFSILH